MIEIPNTQLELPDLLFGYDSLEPIISRETVQVHYGGHHAEYIRKFNKALLQEPSIEKKGTLRFNFMGHLLHSLYWESIAPVGTSRPRGALLKQIIQQFGSLVSFIDEVVENCLKVSGSGWTIVSKSTLNSPNLAIQNIPNHELGRLDTRTRAPIFVLDAWEHAYYLDYQNKKNVFFKGCMKLLNWDVAEYRFRRLLDTRGGAKRSLGEPMTEQRKNPDTSESVPDDEIELTFSRSGGPGGQNVNKVNTKVNLSWNLTTNNTFTDNEKLRLVENIPTRFLKIEEIEDGVVVYVKLTSTKTRSRDKNIRDAKLKLQDVVKKALIPKKKRIISRVQAPKKVRRKMKEQLKEKKQRRKKDWD